MNTIISILKELWYTLADAAECADLPGHLKSWWSDTVNGVTADSLPQEAL